MMSTREEKVINFLNSHPKFLENYVTGPQVSRETFHSWILKRNKADEQTRNNHPESWLADDLEERREFLSEISGKTNFILYELGNCCSQLIKSNKFDVIINKDNEPYLIVSDEGTLNLKKITKIRKSPLSSQKLISHDGTITGEITFNRTLSIRDRTIINVLCTWVCSLLRFTQDSVTSDVENDSTDDIVSMDTVIKKVMNFAQKLTNADRASLFLVDQKTNELYARIFDVGTDESESPKTNGNENKEIRFPAGKGISGYVASTGQSLNIEDAYEDARFNKEVDQKTGYKTRNILCMPIFIRGSVIGVVQMVNKSNGNFTKQDENSFETFAVYCGLALHHAKLYDKIKRSEQKYRVALEVLTYHNVCSKDEIKKINNVPITNHLMEEIENFDFSGSQMNELKRPAYAIYMFKALFEGIIRYDHDDLVRFVLTVRKNYRRVAYHNWAHGWSVAHAMFVILKKTNIFTPFESLALYVACLCHDLDHRGKNNAFMKSMSTPLAAVYSTSVMEHHHFNQTVTILQQDGHNILKSLSSHEYKMVLRLIKHCILATDLAIFFPNKTKLMEIIEAGDFNWEEPHHRVLMEAILMTGCDLIAATKPWETQTETVKVIFEEFYEQGDAERLNGREPIAMMDRNKAHELPKMQVGFMRGICIPCYEIIVSQIPEVQILLDRCESNAKKWEELAEEQDAEAKATEDNNT